MQTKDKHQGRRGTEERRTGREKRRRISGRHKEEKGGVKRTIKQGEYLSFSNQSGRTMSREGKREGREGEGERGDRKKEEKGRTKE